MIDLSNINIRTLLYFIAVYDAQSFSEVARREGVSASRISRAILQLEEAAGQPLFYRNTRAIIPTEAARNFIDYARAIADELSRARASLQERSSVPAGPLRINTPVYFGQRHVAPWLSGLLKRYPLLQIELTQTDDFIDPLKSPADLIFRIGTLTDSSLRARIIGTQRYYLAASPDYLARHGAPRRASEIVRHQCLVYKGSSGPNRWLMKGESGEWIQHPVTPVLSSNHAESLRIAALDGMGIVLFPDWLIADSLKSGALVRLLPEHEFAIHTEPQHIAAIYPNARQTPLNVRAAIDYFVDVFGSPLYWQVE